MNISSAPNDVASLLRYLVKVQQHNQHVSSLSENINHMFRLRLLFSWSYLSDNDCCFYMR